ncbi:MAG: translation initiation factor IF-6 [Candidatus Kariarchaeaceae archaeon]
MMELNSIDLLGNSSIGIFGTSTNTYAIFPHNIKYSSLEQIMKTLSVPLIITSISNSHLNGLFTIGNSKHLLLPSLVTDDEVQEIQNQMQTTTSEDVTVHIVESKITALGNTIVCDDDVALIHPEFTSTERKMIADCLDVEVESRFILNNPLVGSLIFRNDNGLLTHPLIPEQELDWLSSFFKVPSDVVTVNRGTPFPRPGIIANNNGVLVGSDTSGPELMRIYEILVTNGPN